MAVDMQLAQFNPTLVSTDSGKESIRLKHGLEEKWQSFSTSLDYAEKNDSVGMSCEMEQSPAHEQAVPGHLNEMQTYAGFIASDTECHPIVASETELFLSLNNLRSDKSSCPIEASLTNVIENINTECDLSLAHLAQAILPARSLKYSKTKLSITRGNDGYVVWFRDFHGELAEELDEILMLVKDFFDNQDMKISAIMVNGHFLKYMGENDVY